MKWLFVARDAELQGSLAGLCGTGLGSYWLWPCRGWERRRWLGPAAELESDEAPRDSPHRDRAGQPFGAFHHALQPTDAHEPTVMLGARIGR